MAPIVLKTFKACFKCFPAAVTVIDHKFADSNINAASLTMYLIVEFRAVANGAKTAQLVR